MRRAALSVLVAVAFTVSSGACETPISPSNPPGPGPGPSPGTTVTYTVSGTVTEFRGGAIAGATVRARPNFPGSGDVKVTITDAQGFYQISGLSWAVIVDAFKDGYEATGFGAFTGDRTLDFVLHPKLILAAGQTVQATIFGDSHLTGEDDTGASCDHKACLMIHVTSPPGIMEARLRWASPNNALGLFLSTGFFAGERACCSSELVARVAVRGGETLVMVSFEQSNGVTPARDARQTFELSTSLVPQ